MTFLPDLHPLADDKALRQRLISLARHWLRDRGEAEDLVQDAYLRIADGGVPQNAVSQEAWLVTVLRNLCIDAWRRQGRYQAVLSQVTEDWTPELDGNPPERLADQAQYVEQALRHLVHTLPAGEVAAVLLHEVFDWSHAELGTLSGRTEEASRQQLRRMLQRLRQARLAETPVDEDQSCLFALCQLALAQRNPAGLVAVHRVARPQAMKASAQAIHGSRAGSAEPPRTQLVQIDNQLALLIQAGDGPVAWLPLGEAFTELA
ncbi:RNA polymerase sigma factor [Pinirhizobacter soli]|uniref:RNA polymerase sigma factor n=1 Tax=Pinirhizobacter soli TaxID=2786953 RepID=UPI002029E211